MKKKSDFCKMHFAKARLPVMFFESLGGRCLCHPPCVERHHDVAQQGDDEGDDQVACAIGHQAHQHEATASHGGHHQERRGTLGEPAQPAQSEREDGGEHDGFEEIVAHQGDHREPPQIAQDEQCADHRAHATDEQHAAGLNSAHDPRAHESSHHEERQSTREHHRGRAVGHPTQACHEVDEIAVDGNLGHLVGKQREESEDEHLVFPQLSQLLQASLVLGSIIVLDLGQVNSREHHGYGEHHKAQNSIRNGHVSAFRRIAKEELPHGKRGEETTQAVERLREIESAGGCLAGSQLGHIGVGCHFEEHKSAADDEEGDKEGSKRPHLGSWDEQQRPQAEEQQPCDNAFAIAPTVDEEPGGNGQQEIADIGGHLDERRLRDGDVHRVLEMLVQHVEDGAREAPKEEQRGDEDEGNHVSSVGQFCVQGKL